MLLVFLAIAAALAGGGHDAKGVVKAFGPNRVFVNIAHDEIPGYMMAMTMTFEPKRAEQLAGLAVDDAVAFRFTETDDGKRILDSIAKK